MTIILCAAREVTAHMLPRLCICIGAHVCAGEGQHIQFAIYPGMDLSHYLAERERWEWDALEITLTYWHSPLASNASRLTTN